MIKARKERVRELIRSLEAVQVRSQVLGKEESTLEGRSSSLTETGAGKNDAAHFGREARDDIQSAIDHMRVAVGDDSKVGTEGSTQATPIIAALPGSRPGAPHGTLVSSRG